MPFTPKGKKILSNMTKQYGPKKAKKVFYASQNKGTISGVEGSGGGTPTAARSRRPIFGS